MADLQGILKICAICALFAVVSHSKVFSRCDLAYELLDNKFNFSEIGDWVCLAERCSGRNSSFQKFYQATNSTVYGLFLISNKFWCSDQDFPDPDTNDCGMPCSKLVGDDITGTLECARIIANANPNFGHWRGLFDTCRDINTSVYIEGCGVSPELPNPGRGQDNVKKSFVLPVTLSLSGLVLLVGLLFLGWKYRRQLQFWKKDCDELTDCIRKHGINMADAVLDKEQILGQGNFGIVYGGQFKKENVAFKTVKDDRDSVSLLYELKVLAFLEEHPHIVRLLGTYTDALESDKLYLVVEGCQLGNLHDYLESNRSTCLFSDLVDSYDPNYTHTSMQFVQTEFVSLHLMLTWSFQIADAMDYLASKKVIHGDLATRNVLLRDKANVKLADFGLSKKLYTNLIYLRTHDKEVPWRWLPPEALNDNKYSTNSDVWSFGVTIWEIYSFAHLPYPNISYAEYIKKLQSGFRLEQPNVAPDCIYEVMLSCWAHDTDSRPTFTTLRDKLFQYLRTDAAQSDPDSSIECL